MLESRLIGVSLTPLKIIKNSLGDIYHGLKLSDTTFAGFGESYFSTIQKGAIKGWKKHQRMTLNLIVPVGEVRFVIFDDRDNSSTKGEFVSVSLSLKNYYRLTIDPGLWMAFQGIGDEINLVQNIANIEHDPEEAIRCDLASINFDWK